VAGEIGKAADEVGFFYVSGAGVDDTLFERMLTARASRSGCPR
jgi:isopenicillin N synthase-like dioxygenase